MKSRRLMFDDPIFVMPRYIPSRGEATDVAFADKSIETEYRRVKTVVKNIFKKACVDNSAARAKAVEITGRRILVPLFVNPRILLVPLKMRKPAVRGDSSYGYVNYFAVEEIGVDDARINVRFFNGMSVPVIGSLDSVNRSCAYATMVSESECFQKGLGPLGNSHKYFYGEGENPATKSDVEELMMEMWRIREAMGI